jgi:hypothetical protein
MNKLILLVAVAISTAVSAQRPPRKVIVETASADVFVSGMITIDSSYKEYTICEKLNWVSIGFDTTLEENRYHWDYENDFYDTLTYSYKEPERYVFDFRNGVVEHSNESTRETFKITSFTYTGPYVYSPDFPPAKGSIMVFTENKDGNNESYSLDFDLNTFRYYLASDWVYGLGDQRRKDYVVIKVTKK